MIAFRPLAELDAAAVQQALTETTARIVEDNPALDLRRGPFFDLLVYYHAVLAAGQAANTADYLAARSLATLTADPDGADPGLVDDVLANYRVERIAGAAAQGEVTIVLSGDTTVTIGIGTMFTAAGQQFRTPATYTAKADLAQINSSGDRLITATADGRYAFTVPVVAVADGPAGQITKDTTVVPAALPTGYVTSYAASDFTGGALAESNAALLDRLQLGVAARNLSNRATMTALLRNTAAFARYAASSIVGYGDPEMIRDRHTIFPLATGGRVDWYIRTQPRLVRTTLAREATLVDRDLAGVGTWQLTLGRDDAPGFYELGAIRPAGAAATVVGGLTVVSEVRALDRTGSGFVPDLATVAEGAFSRYQTATVQFRDDFARADDLALGAVRTYDVEVRHLPLIGAIQDLMTDREVRHYGADCLVKAPIPCFVQVSLTIHKQAGAADPDQAAIKEALAAAVNATGFTGRLYASTLHEAIAAHVVAPTATGRLDLLGRLLYPTLATRWLRSAEVLTIPADPAHMIGPRTVQFFTDPEAIAITVVTSVPTAD